MKPLQPLAEAEPARGGEDPADCWCAHFFDVARADAEFVSQRLLATAGWL
jgi:hypothetical protein